MLGCSRKAADGNLFLLHVDELVAPEAVDGANIFAMICFALLQALLGNSLSDRGNLS